VCSSDLVAQAIAALGGAGTPAYGAWRRTVDSPAGTNPFVNTAAVEMLIPSGITYTSSTGEFTVNSDGIYAIDAELYIEGGNTLTIYLYVNGILEYQMSTYVHTSVDPVNRSISALLDLKSGDDITINTSASVLAKEGTTMRIIKQ